MRRRIEILLFAFILLVNFDGYASALIAFDADVTPDVIFGSGNANGSFTVDQNDGVELGLRAKLRHNASGAPENTFNSNGDGTYSFKPGIAPGQSFPTAEWSFEWSINTNYDGTSNSNLADLTYYLGLDTDPTLGTSFFGFDPINDGNGAGAVYWDHAIGDNTTGNGTGTVAGDPVEYANLIATKNVAQQSWKPHWFIIPFDPEIDGTYDFVLEAFKESTSVARTEMQVIVGKGGAPVPEPATMFMVGTGLFGLFGARKKIIK